MFFERNKKEMNKEKKCCSNCKYWSYYEGCTYGCKVNILRDPDRYLCTAFTSKEKEIDKCDNKDKICKSRAECMREISEQNKFNVEEEFKRICKKERETTLENIHKAIEEKAKKGNRSFTFVLHHLFTDNFRTINYQSSYYYFNNCFSDCFGTYKLKDKFGSDSYVWNFVDKLDYGTAKRMCQRYVYDWIKQTLKDEGFNIEYKTTIYSGKISVKW